MIEWLTDPVTVPTWWVCLTIAVLVVCVYFLWPIASGRK